MSARYPSALLRRASAHIANLTPPPDFPNCGGSGFLAAVDPSTG